MKSQVKQEQMGFLCFICLFTNRTEIGYDASDKLLVVKFLRMGRIC